MSEINLPPDTPKPNEDEIFPQGLHVVVEQPQVIYRAMRGLNRSDAPSLKIQNDRIDDALCGYLTTEATYHHTGSSYNPNSYKFVSEIHNEGRKLSQLLGFRGYVDAGHLSDLLAELQIRIGGKFEVSHTTFEKQTVRFEDKGERYVFDLGFTSPSEHTKWIQDQIVRESLQRRQDHYTALPELLRNLINENITIGSIWHEAVGNLESEGVFKFKRDLEHYAIVYEACLHSLYSAFDRVEPNKILKIKPS